MKVNSDMPSVINLIQRDEEYQKKAREKDASVNRVTDVVSVENKAASRSHVDNVDAARALMSDLMRDIGKTSSSVHNLDQNRISKLIS
jgi:hypothetical protein